MGGRALIGSQPINLADKPFVRSATTREEAEVVVSKSARSALTLHGLRYAIARLRLSHSATERRPFRAGLIRF
jgi:hypothetical protein